MDSQRPGIIYAVVFRPEGKGGRFWPEPPRRVCYVGQARNYMERWRHHLGKLRTATHANVRLQAAFDLWGEGSMSYVVLQRFVHIRTYQLDQAEATWIRRMIERLGGLAVLNSDVTPGERIGAKRPKWVDGVPAA